MSSTGEASSVEGCLMAAGFDRGEAALAAACQLGAALLSPAAARGDAVGGAEAAARAAPHP